MSKVLSEFENGFNAGLQAAVDYHEKRADAADHQKIGGMGTEDDDPRLKQARMLCIDVMMAHRAIANALRNLRKLTDDESAEQQRAAEALDR